jgi:hypothetical protein
MLPGCIAVTVPSLFGLLIISTASEPQLPQRPWRSRSVGTRQSAHHQFRLTQVCSMTTFVYDMAPILGQVRRKVNRSQVTFFGAKMGYRSTTTIARRPGAQIRQVCSYHAVFIMLTVDKIDGGVVPLRLSSSPSHRGEVLSKPSAQSAPSGVSSCLKYTNTSPHPAASATLDLIWAISFGGYFSLRRRR